MLPIVSIQEWIRCESANYERYESKINFLPIAAIDNTAIVLPGLANVGRRHSAKHVFSC